MRDINLEESMVNVKRPIKTKFISLSLFLLFCLNCFSQKDYVSAEVYSNEQVLYGKWELRMKSVNASGVVSAFFLYENDSWISGNTWYELDIEVLGKNPYSWQSNIIYGNPKKMAEEHHHSDADLSEVFTTYTVEWEPNAMRWYVNEQLVRDSEGPNASLCDVPMSYRFNLWPTNLSGWAGNLDDSRIPCKMYIDYLSYSSYTPGTGNNGSDFTQQWTDDFDSFDSSRWTKANHTFTENVADFIPEQAYSEDGFLILELKNRNEIIIDSVSSLGAISLEEKDVQVFPNPAIEFVLVLLPYSAGFEAKLYSISGKVINSNQFNASKTQIDVSKLRSGLYFLEVSDGISTVVKKIIIE